VHGTGNDRTTAMLVGFKDAGAAVTALVPSPVGDFPSRPAGLHGIDVHTVPDPWARATWPIELGATWIGLQDRYVAAHRRITRSLLADNRRFDLAFASAPPFSALTAASRVARSWGIALVADLRDEWANNPFAGRLGPVHHVLERRRETAAMPSVSGVSAPIPEILSALVAPFAGPTRVIEHGAHVSAIRAGVGAPPGLAPDEPLTIVYAGNRYGDINESRFIETFARVADPPRVRLRLVGSTRAIRVPIPPSMTVEVVPHVPHAELLREYRRAHAVLNFLPSEGGQRSLRSKFEEYKATGRPIVAFAPHNSRLYRTARTTAGAYAVSEGDPAELGAALAATVEDARRREDFFARRTVRDWRDVGQEAVELAAEVIDRHSRGGA
jgi:glycosyltransferase involved in cell wall biosynthesis